MDDQKTKLLPKSSQKELLEEVASANKEYARTLESIPDEKKVERIVNDFYDKYFDLVAEGGIGGKEQRTTPLTPDEIETRDWLKKNWSKNVSDDIIKRMKKGERVFKSEEGIGPYESVTEALKSSESAAPSSTKSLRLSSSIPAKIKSMQLSKVLNKLPYLGSVASAGLAAEDLKDQNEAAAGIDVIEALTNLGGPAVAKAAAPLELLRPSKTVSEKEEMKELDERKFRQIQNMLKQRGISSEEFEK